MLLNIILCTYEINHLDSVTWLVTHALCTLCLKKTRPLWLIWH